MLRVATRDFIHLIGGLLVKDNVRIKVEARPEPHVRKLARALISMARRQLGEESVRSPKPPQPRGGSA